MGELVMLREEHQQIYDTIRRFRPIVASSLSRPLSCYGGFGELWYYWDNDHTGLEEDSLFDFDFERAGSSVSISAYTLPTRDRFYVCRTDYEQPWIIAATRDASADTELLTRLFDFKSDTFGVWLNFEYNIPDFVGISDRWPFEFWKERFLCAFRQGFDWDALAASWGLHDAIKELGTWVDALFPPLPDDDEFGPERKFDARELIERCTATQDREELLFERLIHLWLAGASFNAQEIHELVKKVKGEELPS